MKRRKKMEPVRGWANLWAIAIKPKVGEPWINYHTLAMLQKDTIAEYRSFYTGSARGDAQWEQNILPNRGKTWWPVKVKIEEVRE